MEHFEYAVVILNSDDFDDLHLKITTEYGDDSIPSRPIEVADYRPHSPRITHYWLSDEEAEQLRKDPRVYSVERPPHLDPRKGLSHGLSQTASFTKSSSISQTDVNWGLMRGIRSADPWVGSSSFSGDYNYTLTGRGVDVVIQDGGITPNHPEWGDENGVSRLQQIDWYAASGISGTMSANHYLDYNGHGSHVASIAAGRTQGWAKNAKIYAVKLSGLDGAEGGGISGTNAFDVIRLWHLNKPIDPATGFKRPTVVNMSWGTFVTEGSSNLPASMQYRGGTYLRGIHYSTLTNAKTNYGWMGYLNGGIYYHSYFTPTYESEVLDMINAGIHVVVAGGNNNCKIDVYGGADYDNRWGNYADSWYHRGGCPGARYAIVVGNLSTDYQSGLENRSSSSEIGPGVHVYAPGTYIMGVSSKDNSGTNDIASGSLLETVTHPLDSNYDLMKITGTSMAAPQVTGLLACLLEAYPGMTPAQAKQWLINNSTKNLMYDTGGATSYNTSYSLVGGNNRIMYTPFSSSIDGNMKGGLVLSNGAIKLR